MSSASRLNYDPLILEIATYVHAPSTFDETAYQTARIALADTLGCAILSLNFPECLKLLGPVVSGTEVPFGVPVPGTAFVLDPIRAAFNLGLMVRWLDYNDTWLAAEWGHPSDNLGGLLAVSDYLSRKNPAAPISIQELLTAMIQAYEIQGVLALNNSLNRVGLDHVLFVKIATAAVTTRLLGGTLQDTLSAISNSWIDGGPLRTYRQFPNTGSRKSWASGDATSRGVQIAWFALQGEMGYPSALTTPQWGFQDALFRGKAIFLQRSLHDYVMRNILFKGIFPAEFHAQTAIESAITLYPSIKHRIDQITTIDIDTHESAIRIIDKEGPLQNPADRDHCLQYMVAIALLKGTVTAEDYSDQQAANPQIDALRKKMTLRENRSYTEAYLDPERRAIPNCLTIHFTDGTAKRAETLYPIGHQKRRNEALPFIFQKCESNFKSRYSAEKAQELTSLFKQEQPLLRLSVDQLMDLFKRPGNL